MPNSQRKRSARAAVSADHVERSSGNVFADLGLPEPDLMLAKAELAVRIGAILSARHLTQREAAKILGIDQPGVSDLLRGHLRRYSSDRLFRFLNTLGQDVEIVVTSRGTGSRHAGRLRVRGAATSLRGASTRSRI